MVASATTKINSSSKPSRFLLPVFCYKVQLHGVMRLFWLLSTSTLDLPSSLILMVVLIFSLGFETEVSFWFHADCMLKPNGIAVVALPTPVELRFLFLSLSKTNNISVE